MADPVVSIARNLMLQGFSVFFVDLVHVFYPLIVSGKCLLMVLLNFCTQILPPVIFKSVEQILRKTSLVKLAS